MTSFRSTADQAKAVVLKKVKHGHPRFNRKNNGKKDCFISSIGTENKYKGCVKRFYDWVKKNGISFAKIDNVTAKLFLKSMEDRCVQKTLDGYRQSLNLVFNLKIEYVISKKNSLLTPRAYRASQIHYLASSASRELSFSIRLAASTGCRAIELDTIAFPTEVCEDNRDWLIERFHGMCLGKRFVVVGKGGLKRSIHVSNEIAAELEQYRLPFFERKTSRGIHYVKRFAIVGGHCFSQQFSRLSFTTFGWSTGAHGLRHHYAQTRIIDLQKMGFSWGDALEIVSQELGHFSTTNTLMYLR